ncbi:selenium metabolism-associated LysR family transcriptional regulator [Aquibacillus sp. 3ASR75-11]|uniref:Selenium metabolism-associated LysR family transcriptional regulator n=1 Tax=Terrihalobacillus insolitus TaxID=2950438 RepID=A0A9X3WRA4_9BACI|nr:selenium metabolism-associated LysR family transcriptional regulator [Terrihalobacillus insolitus]MDC3412049.1 selenium metabolism-associated LysR family transcriptional regulator [Terrihalobacillus insolitus]MDC3423258.1 selenium metabolism-associated LysR family transcriptional regulator [Terrihalobacillus insolitus]
MNLEHLKVFYTAATKRNFSETAKILHLSQPSVSLQIRQLEEHLNIKLFERTTKKIALTPAGELLYQYAEKIIRLVHKTEKEIEILSESIHGELHVGASLTVGEHVLPYVLGEYIKEFPNVDIKLKILNSEQIIEHLKNGIINLGFIESMISYPDLTQKPFLEDELVIIAPSSYADILIGENDVIEPNDVFSLPIILREKGSGTRQVVEEHLRKNGMDPDRLNVILELENTESIKSAVESGMGVSIISKSAIRKELKLKTLRAISIEGIKLTRYFYFVYDEMNITLPSESFISFITKYFSSGQGILGLDN